ncbi:DUF3187 family protein [Vibrio sp. Isolate33]|uniref:DUF3187 family protein n=1 Tax=Vibrio sp. Isolate33 TaxID=2908539 RepID=UPI001EFE5903|nr:DUF3187 family protein [Vibrio sp. Isolate33]MCG9542911.1 DUF3187 family protein [Vibrio sp. Isolate33]
MEKQATFISFIPSLPLIITAVIYTPATSANKDYGSLISYTQAPLQSVRLTPTLRSGFPLEENKIEVFSALTAASIWANSHDYHLDYYQNQLQTGLRWQLTKAWQVEFNYRYLYAANNHLDKITINFHDLFDIDQAGRDRKERHQFDIYAPDHDINVRDFSGDTLTSAFTLYTQYQIIDIENHGLSFGISLYHNNVSHGAFEGSSTEQSAQFNYAYQLYINTFYTSLGVANQSNREVESGFSHKKTTWSWMGGYQLTLFENHELHLEYRWYEGAEDGETEFSESANEMMFGYRYVMQRSAIEVSIIENIFNMDNSTDVAFQLAYRHQW